jgi:bacillopeptidase F
VASFKFNGTGVTFVTARGPGYGRVDVRIDGVLRSSNLDLYASTQQWRYAVVYGGLTRSSHTIEIRPKGTRNASATSTAVVVDAFTGFVDPLQQ